MCKRQANKFIIWRMVLKTKLITSYIIFGILTTIVNIAVFYILTQLMGLPYLISNAFAWILSILFAYVTNRQFVFNIDENNRNNFSKGLAYFFSGRLLTGMLDMGVMFALVTILSVNITISKILVNIIVVVLNFLISKFIIFNYGG